VSQSFQTPVALIIFNRPDTTQRVLEAVRQAAPSSLFVIADGPRNGHPGDANRCAAARAVIEKVDWDCDIYKNYSDENLGIKRRVDSGITWMFSLVEEAIILEDDCVPGPSFFLFCEQLLSRYRDHEQVMMIAGNNFLSGIYPASYSYSFSRYPLIWGWATWRRAWQRYDPDMQRWPELQSCNWLARLLCTPASVRYWSYTFKKNYETLENWDFAWTMSCWLHDGLSITPSANLVSNIGFRQDATHTKDPDSRFANMPAEMMAFPLQHPPSVQRDEQADILTEKIRFSGEYFLKPMFAATHTHIHSQRKV
jgi:hypothetical protein